MTTSALIQTKKIPYVAGMTRVGIGAAMGALTGVMLIFAFQPYSIWFLAFIAFIPALIAAYLIVPRKWAGVPLAVGNFIWLFVMLTGIFGLDIKLWFFPAIAFLVALMNIISEPGFRLFHERTAFRWFVLQGAVNVVGFELIRSFIPAISTHLFMVQTAYTQPWLLQPISIFSIYGLSLLIMVVNYALASSGMALIGKHWNWFGQPAITLDRSNRWLIGSGIVLVVWCAIGVITLWTSPKDSPTVRVAAIQMGFLKPGHLDPTTQEARLEELSKQTRYAASQGAKLMVWPELGLGFDPQVEFTEELKSLAQETDAYLMIGYGVVDDTRGWRNEMVMLSPAGEFSQVYGKNHNSSPGESPIVTSGTYPVFDTPLGRFATIICNDVNFTDTTRKLAINGAQLVAVPTWEVSMPGFHYEMPIQGVLRAVENRVSTVKADTAHSALIVDPYGRIIASRDGAPNGEAFALVADVQLGTANTLYMKLGDWVGWFCLAGVVFFNVYQTLINKNSLKTPKSN